MCENENCVFVMIMGFIEVVCLIEGLLNTYDVTCVMESDCNNMSIDWITIVTHSLHSLLFFLCYSNADHHHQHHYGVNGTIEFPLNCYEYDINNKLLERLPTELIIFGRFNRKSKKLVINQFDVIYWSEFVEKEIWRNLGIHIIYTQPYNKAPTFLCNAT